MNIKNIFCLGSALLPIALQAQFTNGNWTFFGFEMETDYNEQSNTQSASFSQAPAYSGSISSSNDAVTIVAQTPEGIEVTTLPRQGDFYRLSEEGYLEDDNSWDVDHRIFLPVTDRLGVFFNVGAGFSNQSYEQMYFFFGLGGMVTLDQATPPPIEGVIEGEYELLTHIYEAEAGWYGQASSSLLTENARVVVEQVSASTYRATIYDGDVYQFESIFTENNNVLMSDQVAGGYREWSRAFRVSEDTLVLVNTGVELVEPFAQLAYAFFETAVVKKKEVQPLDCFFSGSSQEGSVCRSPWFGNYLALEAVKSGSALIWSQEHGIIYAVHGPSGTFLWDFPLNAWLWTTDDFYPYLYSFTHGWLYFLRDSNPRLFYNFANGNWMEAAQG